MRNSLTKALMGAGVACLALLSLSAATWSMGPGGGGMYHDPARMIAHMSDKLNLSEEQQSQVEEIMGASRAKGAEDRKRMQELRTQMHAQQANFNAGEAQKIADEIGEITGRMVFQASSSAAQVNVLLTDDQKAQMQEMMKQRGERRGKRREGGKKSQE